METYIIEMKDKFAPSWTKALEVPADQTAATIAGLTQGEEYQFRVRAKNKAGPGAPSEESDTVVAKPRHCKNLFLMNLSFIHHFRDSDVALAPALIMSY